MEIWRAITELICLSPRKGWGAWWVDGLNTLPNAQMCQTRPWNHGNPAVFCREKCVFRTKMCSISGWALPLQGAVTAGQATHGNSWPTLKVTTVVESGQISSEVTLKKVACYFFRATFLLLKSGCRQQVEFKTFRFCTRLTWKKIQRNFRKI